MKNEYLPSLLTILQASTDRATREFGGLSPTQLNWKPDPQTWSVGQCLHHLITSNATYFGTFQGLADGSAKQGLWARISPFSGMFGNMLLKGTGAEVKQKMKSPKPFAPTQGNVQPDIVQQFVQHQATLEGLLRKLDRIDTRGIKIPSPAAGIITYRLDVAIAIIVHHEVRHLNQASRLLTLEGFPKS